jgi:aromatic-amino-acid transaminase
MQDFMTTSLFSDIPAGITDPILGVTEAFRADTHPSKVNLGVGIYQDANGKVPILESVKKAAAIWASTEDTKAYLPIDGVPTYNAATQELIFGKNSPAVADKRVATIQTVGGSGALKLAIDFIHRFFPESAMYVSDPSWENHRVIFEAAGVKVETYPYYNPATNGLRSTEMLDALRRLRPRSAVLLHACCHNPTGVDIDAATWAEVAAICEERGLIPLVDCAYQGFGAGLKEDAAPVRAMAERGLTFFVASSYAKSFAMYRERVGALSIVTGSAREAANMTSQIKRGVRMIYSSPPSYGAQVIAIALTSPELRTVWERELTEMRVRIKEMREVFAQKLAVAIPNRDFSFILNQHGMFSYSGLSAETVRELRERYHIYALDSGRICVAALNHKNVDYVCDAIAQILKGA